MESPSIVLNNCESSSECSENENIGLINKNDNNEKKKSFFDSIYNNNSSFLKCLSLNYNDEVNEDYAEDNLDVLLSVFWKRGKLGAAYYTHADAEVLNIIIIIIIIVLRY